MDGRGWMYGEGRIDGGVVGSRLWWEGRDGDRRAMAPCQAGVVVDDGRSWHEREPFVRPVLSMGTNGPSFAEASISSRMDSIREIRHVWTGSDRQDAGRDRG